MSDSVLDPSLNLLTDTYMPKNNTNNKNNKNTTDSDKTPKKRLATAAHWVFTYNHPPDDFIQLLHVVPEIKCFVVQKEKGICGTPHLQGYVEFKRRVRAPAVIDWTSKIYWEICKSIPKAIAYCQKKETRVAGPWFKAITPMRAVQEKFAFKPWQLELLNTLSLPPHPRKIYWYCDLEGGKGKTEIAKWLAINRGAAVLGGKGADMKDAIARMRQYPDIVIIDVPRCTLGYISYQGIEEVKNGIFFSGKYESKMVTGPIPHLIVFANEEPNYEKLSKDRWEVIHL